MFSNLAKKIALTLKKNNTIDDERYEICRYGIQQGLCILLNIISTMIIGLSLGMFWQAIIFSIFYIPLRANAGGYHADNAIRCYIYSVLWMIAVLLAIKFVVMSNFICVISFLITLTVIIILAPVEDSNKVLDSTEKKVYKRRAFLIAIVEGIILSLSLLLNFRKLTYCIVWSFLLIVLVLLLGKIKNRINNSCSNAQH